MELKALRVASKISQRDLAKAIDEDVPMLSRYENYKCLPIPTTMNKLTEALGCSISDIYSDHEVYYKRTTPKKRGKARKTDKYHLSGYLPAEARELLPKMVAQQGYSSITEWLNDCYKQLKTRCKEK